MGKIKFTVKLHSPLRWGKTLNVKKITYIFREYFQFHFLDRNAAEFDWIVPEVCPYWCNNSTLVEIKAWCQTGNNMLPESMVTVFIDKFKHCQASTCMWIMMTSSNGNIFHVTGFFCGGIHWSAVNSLHKGQWHGALIFSLICAWINDWVNNREAGDQICHNAYHCNVLSNTSVKKTHSNLLKPFNLSRQSDAYMYPKSSHCFSYNGSLLIWH